MLFCVARRSPFLPPAGGLIDRTIDRKEIALALFAITRSGQDSAEERVGGRRGRTDDVPRNSVNAACGISTIERTARFLTGAFIDARLPPSLPPSVRPSDFEILRRSRAVIEIGFAARLCNVRPASGRILKRNELVSRIGERARCNRKSNGRAGPRWPFALLKTRGEREGAAGGPAGGSSNDLEAVSAGFDCFRKRRAVTLFATSRFAGKRDRQSVVLCCTRFAVILAADDDRVARPRVRSPPPSLPTA